MLAAMMFAAALTAGDPEPPTAPMPIPRSAQPAAQPAAPPAPPPPPRDSMQACQEAFETAPTLIWSDPARGLGLVKRLETHCDLPQGVADALPALHALMELRLGHPKAALAALDAHPTPPDSDFWPLAHWQRLSALEMLGDLPGYRTERNMLLAANAAAIAGGPPERLKKTDHFETANASVDVFVGRVVRERSIRLMFFVAAPKDGGPIVTVVLELDPQATDASEKLTRYLINVYSCEGKEFITSVAAPGGAGPPSYDVTKAFVLRELARKGMVKPFAKQAQSRFCSFSGIMLPGLANPL